MCATIQFTQKNLAVYSSKNKMHRFVSSIYTLYYVSYDTESTRFDLGQVGHPMGAIKVKQQDLI